MITLIELCVFKIKMMKEVKTIDSSPAKKKFIELCDSLGVDEPYFFELIHSNRNITRIEDLIHTIDSKTNNSVAKPRDYQQIIQFFKSHNGILSMDVLQKNAISRYKIKKLEEQGEIVAINRRIYALKSAYDQLDEWVEVSLLIPEGVLCLYSALAHHELTTYTPSEYQIAMSRKVRKKLTPPDYLPVKMFSYDDKTFDLGLLSEQRGDFRVRVYDRERTICDIVKYRERFDANVLKESLNNYAESSKKNYTKLFQYAEKLRVKNILSRYFEVL
ncbi:type IV toxin-antitoxin system AbiEi family antitoxin domain-containing protein [Saccharibacillus sacchari]|uniref:type IV toxin-antitoxin system AbiEi family antitoxin domain-containing protein n=1 Tax=Saccharibacillus sacchari TaxID=456493 RepID=UPI0004B0ACBD|nr:hypothetical protein [Saccharibacillus sacchari]